MSIEDIKLPDPESLKDFYTGLGQTLEQFQNANKDIALPVIMRVVIAAFLSYPYSWFESAGRPENFLPCLVEEVTMYAKMAEQGKNDGNNL